MVIHRLLDRPDGKLQGAISYLTGFRTHLGWFHVDKLLLFQLANVLGYGVSTHPGVLTNASDAGPALMCLPVLTVNQVGVDGQLTGGKSQSENLIGQKKIMAQWAALSVSVLEFRGVTSLIPWRYLPDDFSRFYTYVPAHVHRENKVYTPFTGIFLHALFKTAFANPFSLFTPPQILRRHLHCFEKEKGWNFFQPSHKNSVFHQVLVKPHQDACRLGANSRTSRVDGTASRCLPSGRE